MTKMIATQPLTYARRALNVGDEFETDNEIHAELLRVGGKAKRAQETSGVAETKRRYKRRDLTAES